MKVKALVLPLHFRPVNFHFPWLVVELISLGDATNKRNPPNLITSQMYFDNQTMALGVTDVTAPEISAKYLKETGAEASLT
jgi:hypothetical protein